MAQPNRRRFVLWLAVAAVMAASPASAARPDLVAAATREGHVTWYTTLLADDASGPLAAAFETRYPGIAVEFIRRNSTRNLQLIVDEAKAGAPRADVFDGTTTAAFLMQAGLVEPYKAESAADIPARYKDPNGYWTAQVLYFQTVGYNADLVQPGDVPKSYEDLLDPRWKGRLAWSVDRQLTGGLGFIVNVLEAMGEQRGMDYLARLSAQDIGRIDSINGVTVALAEKRYAIGVTIDNHHTLIANEKGGNVGWVAVEPVLGLSNNIGLVKNAPHPNAARLLIEFILSEEGQTVLKNGNHIPASAKVAAPDPRLKEGFRVNYMSPERGVEATERGVAVLERLFPQFVEK